MRCSHTSIVMVSLFLVSGLSQLQAATLTVTSLADSGSGSLREAIAIAAPGDTIDFAVTGTILLTGGQLSVSTDVTISGPGEAMLAIDGAQVGRVLDIAAGAIVSIHDVTIQNGMVPADGGGGIRNLGALTLERITVQDNRGYFGGGIYSSGSLLEIEKSLVAGNGCFARGGGIHVGGGGLILKDSTIESNSCDNGGGIYLGQGVTADIERSLIADNNGFSFGGGILNSGNLALTNSTISGNIVSSSFGGGILNGGAVVANGCTIAFNTQTGVTGGGLFTARNTIIAHNTPAGDFSGTLTSAGHNLLPNPPPDIVGDTTGNIYGVDPQLGPLADNGGPTRTHAAGDPIVDLGDNADATSTDQRGFARVADGDQDGTAVIDIGAFERQCTDGLDTDGDGISDVCDPDDDNDGVNDGDDNCPLTANSDQADCDGDHIGDVCEPLPCNFVQRVEDILLDFNSPEGRGAATLTWRTNGEVNLEGFNIVRFDNQGHRVQINVAIIPCVGCVTGLPQSYSFTVPKHKSGRDLFVEMVHSTGVAETFGPAIKQ